MSLAGMPEFLPWQRDLAQAWLGDRNRFSHAWLIHGMSGIGKREFAKAAAAALLCEAPQAGLACGACAACHWVAKGSHPDLRLIRPDAVAQQEGETPAEDSQESTRSKSASKDIRVEQLRALHDWFNTATHRGGWRVAVLYPAEALNMISANALLKVLEEPPEHTLFLVVADAPDKLLPTLVSRCRRLPLPVPDRTSALKWLQDRQVAQPEAWLDARGGAPLHALAFSQESDDVCPAWLRQWANAVNAEDEPDYMQLAQLLEAQATQIWLDTLQRFIVDLQFATLNLPVRYFPSLGEVTTALAGRTDARIAADAAKWLNSQSRLAGHPLNARLFAYKTLHRLGQACRGTVAV
ncbi:DNA polymerase III subunit delta' [Pusillimonas sp. CC-YST705]|uniref:DNA polymerase III subunit delta n=1 Tax=Mesopusillimonas faecipullorum TaxID=2755040 RepID=A0ABS8CB52_9BURK|nr:DNA polymerase III subunit delta' [Mesopusillimonas faecipullorum]MCB5363092.1 DNA polymerase III subunit delta' [Mesopusillimonas faecipullorum]